MLSVVPKIIKKTSSFNLKEAPRKASGILVIIKGKNAFRFTFAFLIYQNKLPETTTRLQTSAKDLMAKKLARTSANSAK